jgi:hypothetical protein
MTSDGFSNRRNRQERPPLLDQEALKTFMAGNPSPEEAMHFMFAILATRSRLDTLLTSGNSETEEEDPQA